MEAMVLVSRADFIELITTLFKTVKPKHPAEAVLSIQDGLLRIDVGGVAALAPAQGVWPGQARVAPQFLFSLKKAPPSEDPVQVSVQGDHLRISSWNMPCVWKGPTPASSSALPIRLPVNPTLAGVLALPYLHPEADIEESGLLETVRLAEQKRDRLIAQAAAVLKPLCVRPVDLRQVVDGCIRDRHGRGDGNGSAE